MITTLSQIEKTPLDLVKLKLVKNNPMSNRFKLSNKRVQI